MKKLFLLFTITLFTTTFIFGQKVWHNFTGSIGGPQFNVISTCGDTLINGETWTILETAFSSIEAPPQIYGSLDYAFRAGLIKEKDGIVEFMDISARSLSVLYNYNLNIGDKINEGTGAEMVVTAVDSMMVFNEYKKRISLYNAEYDYDDVWVESVGSIKNHVLRPGEPKYAPDSGSDLICMNVDGDLAIDTNVEPGKCLFDYYPNFVFPCKNAGTNSTKNNDQLILDLKVFPNPFNETINLESSTPFQKIELFDLNGKLVFKQNNFKNLTTLELNNTELSNGIYLLTATAEDGTFAREMVAKNNQK